MFQAGSFAHACFWSFFGDYHTFLINWSSFTRNSLDDSNGISMPACPLLASSSTLFRKAGFHFCSSFVMVLFFLQVVLLAEPFVTRGSCLVRGHTSFPTLIPLFTGLQVMAVVVPLIDGRRIEDVASTQNFPPRSHSQQQVV